MCNLAFIVMRQGRNSGATEAFLCLLVKKLLHKDNEAVFAFRQKGLFIMRQGRGNEATEAVFAFRLKSLFIAGRTSIGGQK